MPDRRETEIYNAIETYLRTHDAWSVSNIDHITGDYGDAIDVMFEVWNSGSIPEVFRGEIEVAMAALRAEWAKFDTPSGPRLPTDDFWQAREILYDLIYNIRDPDSTFYIEPMAELKAIGVDNEQIARMYGLVDASGVGKGYLVKKELENPGSVIGPDWEHPDAKEKREKAEAKKAKLDRLRAIVEAGHQEPEPEPFKYDNPLRRCPETPEVLYYQEVDYVQAAQMLDWSLERVQEEYDRLEKEGKPTRSTDEVTEEPHSNTQDVTIDLLKEEAKELGVAFGRNIGYDTLLKRVEAAREKQGV